MTSLLFAYILWFFAGWTGLHLFYVGRDEQHFMYMTTCGGFFMEWVRDGWNLPRYVEEASPTLNAELRIHEIIVQTNPAGPSWFQPSRFLGTYLVAGLYGYVASSVIDASVLSSDQNTQTAVYNVLFIFGAAFGVSLVGNLGMHTGSLKEAMKGAVLGTLLNIVYSKDGAGGFVILCSFVMFSRSRRWTTIEEHQHRRGNGGNGGMPTTAPTAPTAPTASNADNNQEHIAKIGTCGRFWRLAFACFVFYSMCFSGLYWHAKTTDKTTGETTRLKDSIDNLVRSPIWGELYSSISNAYHSGATWENFFDAMSEHVDLDGENSARKTLNVKSDATWKDIKSAHRRLAKELHPDKGGDPAKFMEMQDAFERLKKKEDQKKKRAGGRGDGGGSGGGGGRSHNSRSGNSDAEAAEREANDEAEALKAEDAEKLRQAKQKTSARTQSEQKAKRESAASYKKKKKRKKKRKKKTRGDDL
jgi:uncharacterized membrane protein YgcG